MKFKTTNPKEHEFLIGLGYEEKQYGYVRHNPNQTTQIVTPFGNNKYQVWGTPEEQEYDEKIYDTGIVHFGSIDVFKTVVKLFEQIK